MPRFRPFLSCSSPDCPPCVETVNVVNGVRLVCRSVMVDKLPDCSFFELDKLAKSNDVRLDPVNPVLFPASKISFDVPASEESEDVLNKPNSEVTNVE